MSSSDQHGFEGGEHEAGIELGGQGTVYDRDEGGDGAGEELRPDRTTWFTGMMSRVTSSRPMRARMTPSVHDRRQN